MKRGWDPIFPVCDENSRLYPPTERRYGASTNRRLANGIGASSPCGAVSTRESSVFFPLLVIGLDIWNGLWTGDGTLSSRGGAGPTCQS